MLSPKDRREMRNLIAKMELEKITLSINLLALKNSFNEEDETYEQFKAEKTEEGEALIVKMDDHLEKARSYLLISDDEKPAYVNRLIARRDVMKQTLAMMEVCNPSNKDIEFYRIAIDMMVNFIHDYRQGGEFDVDTFDNIEQVVGEYFNHKTKTTIGEILGDSNEQ